MKTSRSSIAREQADKSHKTEVDALKAKLAQSAASVESLEKPDLSSILNPETYLEELENREREAKGWSSQLGFSF